MYCPPRLCTPPVCLVCAFHSRIISPIRHPLLPYIGYGNGQWCIVLIPVNTVPHIITHSTTPCWLVLPPQFLDHHPDPYFTPAPKTLQIDKQVLHQTKRPDSSPHPTPTTTSTPAQCTPTSNNDPYALSLSDDLLNEVIDQ
jgi:hypothetical protein